MDFSLHRILQFVYDIALVLWFFRPLRKRSESFKAADPRFADAILLLLAFMYFYDEIGGVELPFIFRFGYRSLIYFGWLLLGKDICWNTALFYGFNMTLFQTCCQNIFFCPLLLNIARGNMMFTGSPLLNEFLCFLIQALTFAVIFWLISLRYPRKSSVIPGKFEWVVFILLLAVEMYVKQSLKLFAQAETSVSLQFSAFSIILNLVILSLLVFVEQYTYSTRRWHEIQVQEIQNRYYLKNLELRQEGVDSVRSLHHDMKNHLLALRAMAKTEDNAQIDRYIAQMLEETLPYEDTIETGKKLLDGLLSEKNMEAQLKQIGMDVRLDFSSIDFLDDMTLCTLFGNALDNAIEACERVPVENGRLIQVKSELAAGQLILYFINTSSGSLTMANGIPETSKADKRSHGIGLKNIHRALSKYHGTFHIKSQQNRFELVMMIPYPDKSTNK